MRNSLYKSICCNLELLIYAGNRSLDRRDYIVFLINFTEVLGFSIVLPVLPFLGLSLGLNEFEIGIVLAIFSATQFIESPVTGKLSDRFGRRPILISALRNSTEETGSIMGVNNSLGSVSRIITPIAGGAILTYLPVYILPLVAGVIYLLMFFPWRKEW